MKYYLLLFFVFSVSVHAQNTKLPKNLKKGDCFIICKNEKDGSVDQKKVDCKLIKLSKKEVLAIQYKLKNQNYDVPITGVMDYKTVLAIEKRKKELKKRKK